MKAICLLVAVSTALVSTPGADIYRRNYDESKVGAYTAPDPLLGKDGKRITSVETWRASRRGEILRDFQDLMYGHTPDLPIRLRSKVIAVREDAIEGLATRTIVRLQFFDDPKAPTIELMYYLPNEASKPAPMFLGMSFYGNASVEADPAIPLPTGWMRRKKGLVENNHATEALRGSSANRWSIRMAIERGYGVATFYYGDVEPDHIEGWRDGIRGYALKRSGKTERGNKSWGALGAWAWGLSRALDYLETQSQVDARRVAVFGHSRLGKAALWAGHRTNASPS